MNIFVTKNFPFPPQLGKHSAVPNLHAVISRPTEMDASDDEPCPDLIDLSDKAAKRRARAKRARRLAREEKESEAKQPELVHGDVNAFMMDVESTATAPSDISSTSGVVTTATFASHPAIIASHPFPVTHAIAVPEGVRRSLVEEASSTMDLTGVNTTIPHRKRAGRKRAEEQEVTPEMMQQIAKRLKTTRQFMHGDKTIKVYHGYARSINKWYAKNRRDLVDETKDPSILDVKRFRQLLKDPKILDREFNCFQCFIETRKHISMVDPETKKPMRALVGTLAGYRSSFGWYVWLTHQLIIPPLWDALCKALFVCLKKDEADKKQKGYYAPIFFLLGYTIFSITRLFCPFCQNRIDGCFVEIRLKCSG